MVLKAAGVVEVLVTWSGSVEVRPSWTAPKSRVTGERVRGEGEAVPRRLMKSSAVLASEVISSALMRVVVVVSAVGCGVKVTLTMQLAVGSRVAQLLWMMKSGVVWSPVIWIGMVPVLARVTVWGWAALPTCVVAKVSELCEAV